MMQRSCYPPTWEQLAYEAKERAGWMCEVCMVPHGAIVRSPRTGNPYVVYLQAAHLNHDHGNSCPELKAVCPVCHARYYRKPKACPVTPLTCKRLRAWRRAWNARRANTKKLALDAWRPGASNETTTSKSQLTQPPFYSSRVQFGWQLDEEMKHHD
jgi:hypothetical protein